MANSKRSFEKWSSLAHARAGSLIDAVQISRKGRKGRNEGGRKDVFGATFHFHHLVSSLSDIFDTVKFDRLMKLLAGRISDKRVLRLIGAYLRAGVKLPEGRVEATTQGVPCNSHFLRALRALCVSLS